MDSAIAEPGRLTRLDGLRGIAATGVMIHHIFFFFFPWQFAAAPFLQIADWLRHFGWTLVDLFFILSGYVFAQVYLRDETLRSRKGMASFWIARIARLWPLHLTMLIIVAVARHSAPANTAYAFAAHLVMLQALVLPVAGTYDWSSWSLTVELFCYLIFAASYACGRRELLWVTALLIIVATISMASIGQPGGPYAGSVFRRGLLGFFLGQALWHGRHHLARIPTPVLVMGMIAGLSIQNGPYTPVLPLSLLTWPSVLLLTLRMKMMEAPALVWLGDRSYAIYLINLPLTQAVVTMTAGTPLSMTMIVAIQLAIVLVVLLASAVSFRWIEAPSRRTIRQLWARHEERKSANGRGAHEGYA
jgi:peptidoglycan/LPS O-acetylase OafA/YrhL